MPDSLQHTEADKAYLPEAGYDDELNDLFRQHGSRKIHEFCRLYYKNSGAALDEIHSTLRPLMKSKRAHRTPPQDSLRQPPRVVTALRAKAKGHYI